MKKIILPLFLVAVLLFGCSAPAAPSVTTTPVTTAPQATQPPVTSDPDLIASVDFNGNWPTDSAGQGVTLTVNSDQVGEGGFDGSGAFFVGQDTGYITMDFSGMTDFDLGYDDFSVSLWFKGVSGGLDRWYTSADKTTEGKKIDLSNGAKGTILFSNRDERYPNSAGYTAAMMNMYQYFAVNATGSGRTVGLDGTKTQTATDARWHKLVMTVEREGYLRIYIDGELIHQKSLSDVRNTRLGSNSLVFGADLNGNYGLKNSYIDNITVYRKKLSGDEIKSSYYNEKFNSILHHIDLGVAKLGSEYTETMRQSLAASVAELVKQQEALTPAEFKQTKKLCGKLQDAYAEFLLLPEQDAKLVSALLSDIHITKPGDTTSIALQTAFRDIKNSGLRIDTMLLTGDLANTSDAKAENSYFDVLDAQMDYLASGMTALSCLGNHDVQYTNESSNYQTGVGTYWERMQAYISLDEAVRRYGSGALDSTTYYVDENGLLQSCCYAMTVEGYHFVALNTDYLTQTDNSKYYVDENGKYTIEGNEVDPIRHGMYLADSTLDWLDKTLAAYAKDGLPIFVIGHFPFDDTCDFSGYDEIVINDNSIGKQDAEIRNILASYKNVVYFCGHAHNSNAQAGPRTVTAQNGGSFVQVNLAALKNSIRGHGNIPTNWIMYVYENEIVLRCRDYYAREWLTEYDYVIPLNE